MANPQAGLCTGNRERSPADDDGSEPGQVQQWRGMPRRRVGLDATHMRHIRAIVALTVRYP